MIWGLFVWCLVVFKERLYELFYFVDLKLLEDKFKVN